MKKLGYLIVFGLIPVLVLGGALLYRSRSGIARGNQPGDIPPPPVDEWETYPDDRFGFRFRYPPDWYVDVSGTSTDGRRSVRISTYPKETPPWKGEAPEGYFKMEIVALVGEPLAPGQSLEEWRNSRLGFDPSQLVAQREVIVAGRNALEDEVQYYPGMIGASIYVTQNDPIRGDYVILIHSSLGDSFQEDVFRRIVETFELFE